MSTFPTIRTVEQLADLMKQVSGASIGDSDLIWFVCVQEALAIHDANTIKDTARMLRDGFKAINSLDDVREFLDTRNEEELEEGDTSAETLYLIGAVYDFYGKPCPEELNAAIEEI